MASKNIPPNGWPQLKDLEAVQPTLNRLDKIEAWKRTVKEETFTGDDFTIPNALKLPARSLKTTIEAIQDLHGYDHPWAGGAGKNKFDITEISDVGNTYKTKEFTLKANETYTISTDLPKNNNNSANLFFFLPGGSADTSVNGVWSGQTRTLTTGADGKFIIGYRTTDYTDPSAEWYLSHKIQIEEGSTATSYAPYANLCPISGRTEARVDTENEDSSESAYAVIQLGQTVYGADINWDTGVMTVNWRYDTFDGSSDELWAYDSGRGQFYITNSAIDNKAKGLIISDSYKGVQVDQWSELHNGEITTHPTSNNVIRLMTDLYNSLDAFKTAISTAPIHVCYEINTPTTIQLTATQLQMLKGYNHITLADGYGTIELKALTGANWS